MSPDLSGLLGFIGELEALKRTERQTCVPGAGRRENSAEHSWQVAMTAWALSGCVDWEVSPAKVLQLALVHDLGEIDAGDTLLYSADRAAVVQRERACVARLDARFGSVIPGLGALWNEQEAGTTNEARLLKIADRLLPFLHNIETEGRTWLKHRVARSQVVAAHAFIEAEMPELFAWMTGQVDIAVERGWLVDA